MSHNFTFCVCSENRRETSVKHSKIHELSTIFGGLACKYTFLQNTEVVQGHALAGRRGKPSPTPCENSRYTILFVGVSAACDL